MPFEAEFAGEVAHAQSAIAGIDLLLADLTHIAHGMSKKTAREITAAGDGDHFEHRDVRSVRFDEGNVRGRSFRFDDDGLEFRKSFRIA